MSCSSLCSYASGILVLSNEMLNAYCALAVCKCRAPNVEVYEVFIACLGLQDESKGLEASISDWCGQPLLHYKLWNGMADICPHLSLLWIWHSMQAGDWNVRNMGANDVCHGSKLFHSPAYCDHNGSNDMLAPKKREIKWDSTSSDVLIRANIAWWWCLSGRSLFIWSRNVS